MIRQLEQNGAREFSLSVFQFIKTLVLPQVPKFDVNTAPKLSSFKRWEVGVLNKYLETISHSLSPVFGPVILLPAHPASFAHKFLFQRVPAIPGMR